MTSVRSTTSKPVSISHSETLKGPAMAVSNDSGLAVDVDRGVATISFTGTPPGHLTPPTTRELYSTLTALAHDDAVTVVLLKSRVSGFFVPHFDVAAILDFPANPHAGEQIKPFHALCELLRTMPKITIAVIEGRCGGGGNEIALSCDLRFAARDTAVFNQPEVALGLIPGGSGTVRLSRLIGRSRALEMVLGCDDVNAQTAESWGMVNRSLDGDELWPFVDRLIDRILGFPRAAVIAAKAAIVAQDPLAAVEEGLHVEARLFEERIGALDAHAAMEEFLRRDGQAVDAQLRLGDFLGELSERMPRSDGAGPP